MKTQLKLEEVLDRTEQILGKKDIKYEAYAVELTGTSVEVEKNEIKNAKKAIDKGIGLRVAKGKKVFFGYATNFLEDTITGLINTALKEVDFVPEDKFFKDFATGEGFVSQVENINDKSLKNVDVEDLVEMMNEGIDSALIDKKVYSVSASASFLIEKMGVINHNGVHRVLEETRSVAYFYPTIKSGQEMTSSYEIDGSRFLSKLDISAIARKASENALALLNARKIPSGKYDVVFDYKAGETFIASLVGAMNGMNILDNKSFLINKLGKKIAKNTVTILEDGLIDGAFSSRPFDDEGTPVRQKVLVNHGLLKNYLYDSYAAGRAGVESTGNGFRADYTALPSVGTTNIIMREGDATFEEMLESIDGTGIYFINTYDRANPQTGDFSGMIVEGFLVKNGEISHPIKQTMLGINILDLFDNITMIESKSRWILDTKLPRFLVKNCTISGGA